MVRYGVEPKRRRFFCKTQITISVSKRSKKMVQKTWSYRESKAKTVKKTIPVSRRTPKKDPAEVSKNEPKTKTVKNDPSIEQNPKR